MDSIETREGSDDLAPLLAGATDAPTSAAVNPGLNCTTNSPGTYEARGGRGAALS